LGQTSIEIDRGCTFFSFGKNSKHMSPHLLFVCVCVGGVGVGGAKILALFQL